MTPQPGTDAAASAAALERVIAGIGSVRAARVIVDGDRIAEVHIVSSTDRAPKQLVRDVQTAAKATFDLDLDYRTISIVQLQESAVTDGQGVGSVHRMPLLRVAGSTSGGLGDVEVALQQDGVEVIGRARGDATRGAELTARATLKAIEPMLAGAVGEIAGVEVHAVGGAQVAVVLVRLASTTGSKMVSGSAVVHGDDGDAVARATLDAVNRLIR